MRVIVRRSSPHPGAQLRLTDPDGWCITCFATNTRGPGWNLAALEVRHRQRARAEDRIRGLKDTGMRNLPFHGFAQNQIWLEIVALASDLLAWTQTLAWPEHEPARRWEPKRLRLRVLATAGRIIRTSRRTHLRLPRDWPDNHLIETGWTAYKPPDPRPQPDQQEPGEPANTAPANNHATTPNTPALILTALPASQTKHRG